MEDVKLSELEDKAIEVVDRAMAGESIRVVNNETRLVITGGDQKTFPPENDRRGLSRIPGLSGLSASSRTIRIWGNQRSGQKSRSTSRPKRGRLSRSQHATTS